MAHRTATCPAKAGQEFTQDHTIHFYSLFAEWSSPWQRGFGTVSFAPAGMSVAVRCKAQRTHKSPITHANGVCAMCALLEKEESIHTRPASAWNWPGIGKSLNWTNTEVFCFLSVLERSSSYMPQSGYNDLALKILSLLVLAEFYQMPLSLPRLDDYRMSVFFICYLVNVSLRMLRVSFPIFFLPPLRYSRLDCILLVVYCSILSS